MSKAAIRQIHSFLTLAAEFGDDELADEARDALVALSTVAPHMFDTSAVVADVSRALGLAQSLAEPVAAKIRPGSMEEIASEIVVLLSLARDKLLPDGGRA
jgi:hypothetical protein